MGSCGVTSFESDDGLDKLAYLRCAFFQESEPTFYLKEAFNIFHEQARDEIIRANRGCSRAEMEMYLEEGMPFRYGKVVLFVADCLNECLTKGGLDIDPPDILLDGFTVKEDGQIEVKHSGNKAPKIMVSNFVYKFGDLKHLFQSLEAFLTPEPYHPIYEARLLTQLISK